LRRITARLEFVFRENGNYGGAAGHAKRAKRPLPRRSEFTVDVPDVAEPEGLEETSCRENDGERSVIQKIHHRKMLSLYSIYNDDFVTA
jgi:hypothetical protein